MAMTAVHIFRSARDTRPPTPFDFLFQVAVTEKLNVGTDDEPVWEERDTEQTAEEVRRFHLRHDRGIPAGLVLRAQRNDPEAVEELLRLAIVEAEEFLALLDDRRTVVRTQLLADLCLWIVEEDSDRPTQPRSSAGR